MTERAKPGDKCVFTGTLIVTPDVAQLLMPGNKMERSGEYDRRQREGDGVSGLKALGVRELTYKLAFLAGMVQTVNSFLLISRVLQAQIHSVEMMKRESK